MGSTRNHHCCLDIVFYQALRHLHSPSQLHWHPQVQPFLQGLSALCSSCLTATATRPFSSLSFNSTLCGLQESHIVPPPFISKCLCADIIAQKISSVKGGLASANGILFEHIFKLQLKALSFAPSVFAKLADHINLSGTIDFGNIVAEIKADAVQDDAIG